jgi:hypothetical protein
MFEVTSGISEPSSVNSIKSQNQHKHFPPIKQLVTGLRPGGSYSAKMLRWMSQRDDEAAK